MFVVFMTKLKSVWGLQIQDIGTGCPEAAGEIQSSDFNLIPWLFCLFADWERFDAFLICSAAPVLKPGGKFATLTRQIQVILGVASTIQEW